MDSIIPTFSWDEAPASGLIKCFFEINNWPRSTMDSIRVSEAPDPGSIPGEATLLNIQIILLVFLKNALVGAQ